jgi:hypothetical protein
MMKILSLVLVAALCAPASAQKMGMTNSNPPALKQSITAGDAKMSLDYMSITWADGKTMGMLADKDKGAGYRERVNKSGPGSPLATFSTSADVKLGELAIPAGEYQVFFTIGDDLSWSMNFKQGDKVLTHKLAMMDSPEQNKRLLLCLYAADAGAGVYCAFGNKMTMLNFTPAAKK